MDVIYVKITFVLQILTVVELLAPTIMIALILSALDVFTLLELVFALLELLVDNLVVLPLIACNLEATVLNA